ncbi:MAG TPA: immunoglobulin domain-containing protein, partial [Opitutaceae bacterium]
MNLSSWKRHLTAALALAIAVSAVRAETTLLLDIGFGIRWVPDSRVTVPTGEYLTVVAPDFGGGLLQWFKNGQPIPGATERALVIQSAATGDAGSYHAIYTAPEMGGRGTQSLQLSVKPLHRLVNLSTRAQVGAGEKTFIAGFVVAGSESKKIIIRAVGPTLSEHGIQEPVALPVVA